MSDGIRIKLSVGLLVAALLHAVVLVGLFQYLHCDKQQETIDPWKVPVANVNVGSSVGDKLSEPHTVNLRAQSELKQQCVDCTPLTRPTLAPQLPTRPVVLPASAVPATPPVKDFQIALFIGSDAKSKQLLDWFNRDSRLQTMRQRCEFQVYTADSPLYRTRYAQDIPPDQFPVVLLQDKSGGHIHAAGKSMIPTTVDKLYADFQKGYELYQQARQAQKTGAIKSRGYSWDAAISPTMQLQPGDCPDGFCPDGGTSDRWTPGERLRDLFNQGQAAKDALLWTSASEIATVVLILAAVILLALIVWKRM